MVSSVSQVKPDGTVCEGTFRDGLLNGQGKVTMPNGEQHVGEWERGALCGI